MVFMLMALIKKISTMNKRVKHIRESITIVILQILLPCPCRFTRRKSAGAAAAAGPAGPASTTFRWHITNMEAKTASTTMEKRSEKAIL